MRIDALERSDGDNVYKASERAKERLVRAESQRDQALKGSLKQRREIREEWMSLSQSHRHVDLLVGTTVLPEVREKLEEVQKLVRQKMAENRSRHQCWKLEMQRFGSECRYLAGEVRRLERILEQIHRLRGEMLHVIQT